MTLFITNHWPNLICLQIHPDRVSDSMFAVIWSGNCTRIPIYPIGTSRWNCNWEKILTLDNNVKIKINLGH